MSNENIVYSKDAGNDKNKTKRRYKYALICVLSIIIITLLYLNGELIVTGVN